MRARNYSTVLRFGVAGAAAMVGLLAGPSAAGQPPLLRFEGQGLTITVTGYDAQSGRLAGQVTTGGKARAYVARTIAKPDGTQYVAGQVTTGAGPVAITIVDESDTVARVNYAGKTYRVKRIQAAPKEPPPAAKPARPAKGTPETVILRKQTLRDPSRDNMASHTVLVPEGWSVKGGAFQPPPKYFNTIPTQDITVTSPEGVGVRVAPLIGARDYWPAPKLAGMGVKRPVEHTPDGGYVVLYLPANLPQWAAFVKAKLVALGRTDLDDVKVVDIGVVPELTAVLKKIHEPVRLEMERKNRTQNPMAPARHFTDTMMFAALATYTRGGRQWEELRVFGVMFLGTDSESGRQIWWQICPNLTFFAPQGRLDAALPLLRAISTSVRPTDAWVQARARDMAKLGEIAVKGAAQRAAAWRLIPDDTGEILHKGWRKREAIEDNAQRKVISAIYETKNYKAADGRTAQLPNTHKAVFVDQTGQIIMTDDVNYNPNTDKKRNKFDWHRMGPVH